MAEAGNREIRQSQTIVPFGVGAIYDIFGESFAACDTYMWGSRGDTVRADALRKSLGVTELRSAEPAEPNRKGIPYIRFPKWLFCQKCRKLLEWKAKWEAKGQAATCYNCRRQLVPIRFIAVCEAGHMGDVPWHIWAHSGSANRDCRSKNLSYRTVANKGAGLASIEIRCVDCKAGRSLAGITGKDSLATLNVHCSGKQPWQLAKPTEQCSQTPHVLQRGASNVYFASIQSALDIPTDPAHSDFGELTLAIETHDSFRTLVKVILKPGPMRELLLEDIATELGVSQEDVAAVARRAAGESEDEKSKSAPDVSLSEWLALRAEQQEVDDRSPLITKRTQLISETRDSQSQVLNIVKSVFLVSRLKEVRALRGFSRYKPGAQELRPDLSPSTPGSSRRVQWLPAAEVYGEGIFIEFDENLMHQWEQPTRVVQRADLLNRRLDASELGKAILARRMGEQIVSPRMLFLHTFSHLLIRELCFESGYSSAALAERIYCRSHSDPVPQAGILIYTAAGDSEGTLGGLVRQGEPPRLATSIMKALETGLWCSADPICRESDGQGYDKTNLAACHACSLLPETSCAFGNMLLDRTMVVAPGKDAELSVFGDPIAVMEA